MALTCKQDKEVPVWLRQISEAIEKYILEKVYSSVYGKGGTPNSEQFSFIWHR